MSNQRSILSFFGGAASQAPKTALPQAQAQATKSVQPPPPPPPSSRFVPPPPRNGAAATMAAASAAAATPRTPAPQPTLPALTPEQGRAILLQAGATADGDDLVFGSSKSLSRCRIVYPRAAHIPGLVSVNAIQLPVRYQDKFYHTVADPTRYASLFNRVVVDEEGMVVGGIVGRLEESPFGPSQLALYIQSLALSSPYRGGGLMAAALQSIIKTIEVLNASDADSESVHFNSTVASIYCHVWTESEDALRWYEANGFRRDAPEPLADYYFKLKPNTAWVVRRDIVRPSVLDAVAKAQSKAESKAAAPPKSASTANGPPKLSSSQSYQNSRPDNEWNDLPADMVTPAVSTAPSTAASVASSRNVSRVNLADAASLPVDGNMPPPPPMGGSVKTSGTTRKKRERAYPAAMFQ